MDKQKIKYGAVVCIYNRAWYILPFLDQMTSLGVECVVALSNAPYVNEGKSESKEPDNSEELCREYFPDVKIVKGYYPHHRDSINAGMRELQNCDIIFINDCDIFLTQDGWKECFKFIESTFMHSIWKVDFEKMILEYYYDYNYGKGAKPGGLPPIMAVRKNINVKNMVTAEHGSDSIWNDTKVKIHHLRFCKNKYGNIGPLYTRPPQSGLDDYKPAPEEIINLFKKWEDKNNV